MRGRPSDRISNLPDGVIDNILKFLPLRDALKTSTLSKQWMYKWRTIPHLIFDWDCIELFNTKYNDESTIDGILLLHKGAITKFELLDCAGLSFLAISRWLVYLSEHHVEDLALGFYEFDNHNEVPDRLFALDELTHLHMRCVPVNLPSAFRGFSRLVRLKLENVSFEMGKLLTLLSKCPMLECLDLQGYYWPMHHVRQQQEVPYEQNRLIVMRLSDIQFGNLECVASVLSLISNSPNLKTLEISYDEDYGIILNVEDIIQYMKAEWSKNVHLHCLEEVKVDGTTGAVVESEFLKILLRWAVALKRMQLISHLCKTNASVAPDIGWMLAELTRFPRASSRAKITLEAKILSW